MYKKLFYIGILSYIVLIIFSVLFYKERVIFLDAAHYMTYMTQSGSFSVQHYRFGAALVQILPLLAIKAKLSLDTVTLLYSLSFSIFFLAGYLICGWVFNNYRLALVLLLFNILISTYTFYYMISELSLAIAMLMILLSYLHTNPPTGPWPWLIMATIVFCHPLSAFAILFSLAFFYFHKEEVLSRKTIYKLFTIFIVIAIIKKLFFTGSYEMLGLHGLKYFVTLFPDYFSLHSNAVFFQNCLDKYYWLPVLLLMISVFYIINKQWLKLLLFLSFTFAYLLLVNVSYPNEVTKPFYIENLYLPLALFMAFPFVFDMIPYLQEKKFATAFFSIILISGCLRIYINHQPFTNRLNWERNFLDKHLNEKLLVKASSQQDDTLLMSWGTPYEFWLLSTTEYKKTASIIIIDKPEDILWACDKKDELVVTMDRFPYKTLPKKYFILTDTVSTYKFVK